MDEKLKIVFNNMEPSEAIRSYLTEKIFKHKNQHLLEKMTMAEAHLTENVHSRGVDQDFQLSINVDLPKKRIHLEEQGSDMYALIDQSTDNLYRMLKKYNDKLHDWDSAAPVGEVEAEMEMKAMDDSVDLEEQDYSEFNN